MTGIKQAMPNHLRRRLLVFGLAAGLLASSVHGEVLREATLSVKITLAQKSTSRPMSVAYIPKFQRYYIADGGLAAMPSAFEPSLSKSLIHVYDGTGRYVQSLRAGFDNRSIYYDASQNLLETITYNVSSAAGFAPNTGIYSLSLTDNGDLSGTATEHYGFNPAFGDEATMPSFDSAHKLYYAKQKRSRIVRVVNPAFAQPITEITLDLANAGAAFDDVTDNFIAYTGVSGQELVVVDIEHKVALVFNLAGRYVGKSALPSTLKLHAQNYYSGLGYANGMLFILNEGEGEFGTYYGLKVLQ